MIDKLSEILTQNYATLGWQLHKLEHLECADWSGDVIQGMLNCPCGGREYFTTMVSKAALKEPEVLAVYILNNTASRLHLERDVAEGKLSAMDIDKHCFKGVLV